MVKKKSNDNLTINTAAVKRRTVVNTSRLVSVPITYELAGNKVSFMLPPSGRQELPEEAILVSHSNFIKVVE